jgi:thiamine pyrophosphate-dependent enzyme
MSGSLRQRMKIGNFLLRRFKEAGAWYLFGLPGDYNLELLQQFLDSVALKWTSTCSELNASYAADGYARLNSLGAAPGDERRRRAPMPKVARHSSATRTSTMWRRSPNTEVTRSPVSYPGGAKKAVLVRLHQCVLLKRMAPNACR